MASILYLSNSRLPSTSANAVQTASMASAFVEIGHAPHLICHAGPGTDAEVRHAYALSDAVDLRRIPQRGPRGTHTALYLADVRAAARTVGPIDVVFARDLHAVSSLPKRSAPLIFEAHRAIAGRLEETLFRRLVRSSRLDRLVVVSAGMKRAFLESFDDLDPSLVVVEPGAASVPRSEGPPFELRRRPGAFQVGYVGGLYRGRGVPVMMEIARALPEVDFHLVGGSQAEVSAWGESAPPNMAFYGHVENTRLGYIYAQLQAVLAPYERRVYTAGAAETSSVMSPLKVFEYMACGLPIIASDLLAIREILDDGETALLVPPDEPDRWAEAVTSLVNSSDLRDALGQRAKALHREKHNWAARAARVLSPFA